MKSNLFFCLFFLAQSTGAQMHAATNQGKREMGQCITQIMRLQYSPVDTIFHLVKKPAVLNIIPAIKACGFGYWYDTGFKDIACQLLLPNWLDSYSMGFGNNDFYLSFEDHNDSSGSCIVLHYSLGNESQPLFFHQLPESNRRCDSLISCWKIMYRFRNSNGMYVGKILLQNNMSIAYYTHLKELEEQLGTCILSCKIE